MQPRALGRVRLDVGTRAGRSALKRLEQSGASRVLFPYGPRVDGVMINTAGGVTGGDGFQFHATVQPNAALRLTTQAAERFYGATEGLEGRIDTRVTVQPGAALEWLPQETIVFDHASVRRSFVADLAANARLLFVEPIVFGRMLMGEDVRDASLRDQITLRRDGKFLFRDTTWLRGDIARQLDSAAIAGGARAMALILFAAPEAEAHLPALRQLCPPGSGVTLIRDGLLAARVLAADGFALRQTLLPLLAHFTDLPRSWSL